MRNKTKKATAQKYRRANERQEREDRAVQPIISASYAAVARRGLVAAGPPASSTHAAEETMEDYEGGRERDDIVLPSAASKSTL
jgi:hypothetical protein